LEDFRQSENPHYFFTLHFYLLLYQLSHLIQHILNKYSIPRGEIVDHNVGDSAYELTILDDGRAAHECGQ